MLQSTYSRLYLPTLKNTCVVVNNGSPENIFKINWKVRSLTIAYKKFLPGNCIVFALHNQKYYLFSNNFAVQLPSYSHLLISFFVLPILMLFFLLLFCSCCCCFFGVVCACMISKMQSHLSGETMYTKWTSNNFLLSWGEKKSLYSFSVQF